MLTQQPPSGPDLVVDSLGDLEESLLWVSVMKGAVDSDLGFSILSLKFPKCLTHWRTTEQALDFWGGGKGEEDGGSGGRRNKGRREEGGGRSGEGGGRRERGGKIQTLAPALCRHEGQCLGSQWPVGLAGGSSYGRRQAGLCRGLGSGWQLLL